jgi:anti-sigma-K factor RskA
VSDRPAAGREGDAVHENLRADLAAYALGALEGADVGRIERHLADCEGCRGYVRWLEPAVDTLPASVEQVRPPASLRASIMDVVQEEARAEEAARRERARPAGGRSWRDWFLRPATAFAAVAALVVGVVVGQALSDSGNEPNTIAAKPTGSAPPGAVAATLSVEGNEGVLDVARMPGLKRNEVYELWVQRGGRVAAAGTFELDPDGTASAPVGGSLEGADAVLVTSEPSGGSLQPTSAPILTARLD